ncbi:hypothetical protein HPB50_006687 [Hyalomma asiaticum]|uniref:Uncharacterized protein n=1 Tax=Hyalomma asiaticum TaxID=266040 RepID=A0ACB7TDV4_HYAAI|nr:hypothetical protein HPB50_006687 [Hyalomma asiaticum]
MVMGRSAITIRKDSSGNPAYTMKEAADPWRGITQPASYYYDPALAAYGYGGLDFNGARRKNVTRDSTSTLKAWLNEHRKNPYPTKGEKIMLAIITKMTLTQPQRVARDGWVGELRCKPDQF